METFEEYISGLIKDMELIRHGVDLAERREKHPSYRMELQGVLQCCDLMLERLRFKEKMLNEDVNEDDLEDF